MVSRSWEGIQQLTTKWSYKRIFRVMEIVYSIVVVGAWLCICQNLYNCTPWEWLIVCRLKKLNQMSGEPRIEWRLWQMNLTLLQIWYNFTGGGREERSWLNNFGKMVCLGTVLKIKEKRPVHKHCTLVGKYISYSSMVKQFWNYIMTYTG